MKKIIFFVTLFIATSVYSQNTVIIDGNQRRVDMMATVSEGYLDGQGKKATIVKTYSAGHNDPSGKTLGTTNGTWVKVSFPQTGTTKFIQISNNMLVKMENVLTDATSEISRADVVNQLCNTQSTSLKEVLNYVSTKQVATNSNDCNCEPKVVYVNSTPNEQVNVNDFETVTNSCDQAKTELAKLETIYKYADRKTIQANGFRNKRAVEQAMIDLAIANPNCNDLALKIQKKNNTWMWIAGGVATVLLADAIEGNGIDLFGLVKSGSNNSPKVITHTEPTGPGSNNGGGTVITHTGTAGKSTASVNSGFGQISSRR
jgi:hypothetical protein